MTVILAAAVFLCACAGQGEVQPVTDDGYYLDTICTVSIYRMDDGKGGVYDAADMEDEARAVIKEAFDLCRSLESKLSRTRKDSDISRLNAAKGGWVEVSDETAELIRKGIEYSSLSEGDFDITIGGVTKLWDFHADEGEAKLPGAAELAEAVRHVDFSKVDVDGNRVRMEDPESEIDLGGIAKGYIGDRMTELLESRGAVSAVINLGGNVICIGGRTDEDDFVIGIEAPFSDRREIVGKVNSRDKTLVTSGVYERVIEVDGKQYHHILDTATGMPADSDLTAVTLIADKGLSADLDASSTICLIKGSKEAERYLEECMPGGVEAVFILKDGSIETTDGAGFEETK